MKNPAEEQHKKRLEDLAKALKDQETPDQCNGFAKLMRDSVVCLLDGQKIWIECGGIFNWRHALAVMMSTIIVCGVVVALVVKLV